MKKGSPELKLSSHMSLVPLKQLPLEKRFAMLPDFLQMVILDAERTIGLEELIVFGSRARGDEKPLSDWDLCFKFPQEMLNAWLKFSIDLPEKSETLLGIDAVSWDEASDALKSNIRKDGLIVWKKNP